MRTKGGQNWYQSIHSYVQSLAGKCPFPCPEGHHHERCINAFSDIVLFDAIPTCGVSKHNSVGLIQLQRRSSDAGAVQCRSIPKCAVKTSAESLQRVWAPMLKMRSVSVFQNVN